MKELICIFCTVHLVVAKPIIFSPCSFAAVKQKEPKDIRNFDYTARSWTGKSPKQFLIDWVRKNLPKSPAPAFHKVAAGRYWRCKYVFLCHITHTHTVRGQSVYVSVCPVELTARPTETSVICATPYKAENNLLHVKKTNLIPIALLRVRVQRPDDVLEVCPTILTEDSMQAQHLAATLALYNLVKGQVTYAEVTRCA